jgi:NAD(P)-dependent dehydrogenase (short-subunit alcohol dehydrogenase family)
MMGNLGDRVAVVTGGATGIGLATASRLAADGAMVVIACRNSVRGEAAAEAIRASGGRATFIQTDVTDDCQVAVLAKRAAGERGAIDIWFNNAGMLGGLGPLGAFDDHTVGQLLDTNVKGVYSGMRHAAEHMHAGGMIINSASFGGTVLPVPVAIAYCGTKAAVVSMTRAAALGLADQGIDVVAVAPWVVDTPGADQLTGDLGAEARAAFAAQFNPSGKLVPAGQVAAVVAGLADRTSRCHSGDVLLIDAGPAVTIMK